MNFVKHMKAKYHKIYAAERLKKEGKEMGFVKEIENNLLIIYKNGSARLEHIENFNVYLEQFETTKCTKKEFKNAFDEAINYYKKLV